MFVYPGLVNTHHHLLQVFTRNIPAIQSLELFDWLLFLYEIWKKVNPEYIYYSSLVGFAELLKYGCTTCFDHHFAFPRGNGKEIIDRQMEAAALLGIRFHAGRSCFSRGRSEGGLPPDELVEPIDEVLAESERVVAKFHDQHQYSMRQVALAPCSPFSVDSEVMRESARLARTLGVRLHTHLAETLDEEKYCLEVYGKRPLAWAEEVEWLGPDVWFAHGIHFNDEEISRLGATGTGVAHCPVSNMKLSSGIARIPDMIRQNVPVGLALDGSASNDGSSLLQELRVAYLLHRLNSSAAAPSGYETLKLATSGGARVLGRNDIGAVAVDKAADLFLIDVGRLEFTGALQDPASFLATVGFNRPVDLTVVNGKIRVQGGNLVDIDEADLAQKAGAVFQKVFGLTA
jgi:cytosine/adenosine deaminase-related metal-dependent hydrolase